MATKNVNKAENNKPQVWFDTSRPEQGKTKFGFIPIQILLDKRVTKTGLQTFLALTIHADAVTGLCGYIKNGMHCTPGYKRLGGIIGLSERSIGEGVKNLVKTGWISKRIRRENRTLVLWLGVPNDLVVVNSDGSYVGVPEVWDSSELPPENKAGAEVAADFIAQAETYEDGEVDLDTLLAMDSRSASRKKSEKKFQQIKRATNKPPRKNKTAKGAQVTKESEPQPVAVQPDFQSVVQLTGPTTIVEIESKDSEGETEDYSAECLDGGIALNDALWDYVRNYDDGGGAYLRNDEIRHLGFTHLTPFSEVYKQYQSQIDAIRNLGTVG